MTRRNAKPRNHRERYARERALAALARMRRERLSLTAAAKAEGTNPRTIARYVGSALTRGGKRGKFRATASDRLHRDLNFTTVQGDKPITVYGSRVASRIAEYNNAIRRYLNERGDTSALGHLRGESFRAGGETHYFITDPAQLSLLANAGALRIESLYRSIK